MKIVFRVGMRVVSSWKNINIIKCLYIFTHIHDSCVEIIEAKLNKVLLFGHRRLLSTAARRQILKSMEEMKNVFHFWPASKFSLAFSRCFHSPLINERRFCIIDRGLFSINVPTLARCQWLLTSYGSGRRTQTRRVHNWNVWGYVSFHFILFSHVFMAEELSAPPHFINMFALLFSVSHCCPCVRTQVIIIIFL